MSLFDRRRDPPTDWARTDESHLSDGILQMLGTYEGRSLFCYIIHNLCRTYKASESLDHAALAYAAGARDVGLSLFALARNKSPEMVQKAINEREQLVNERRQQTVKER